jgi:hypothetical protein
VTDTPERAALEENDISGFAGELGKELGVEEVRTGSWFTKLVLLYLRRYSQQHHRLPKGKTDEERAERIIRRACLKSAAAGAAAATTATGAAFLTLQTHFLAGIAAVPTAVAGILGETLYRALVHVELTCDLASLYGMRFDADDPAELWRLYSMAFGLTDTDDAPIGQARDVIDNVVRLSGAEVGQSIGTKLLTDTVKRSAVPVAGIATSAVSNWKLTRKMGDTVHQYLRYHRALSELMLGKLEACGAHSDLLLEGIWFVFTADGRLKREETAILAWLLRRLDPVMRTAVCRRFIEDEQDWMDRLKECPEDLRDVVFHGMEVAAAVDKVAPLPERRLLRNAARALGRTFDPVRLAALARELEARGVTLKEA